MICRNCPHYCEIKDAQSVGKCGVRKLVGDEILPANYGEITSLALDPIEKKPLSRFRPGTFILSVGSWGCNMTCPWCQNEAISRGPVQCSVMSPKEVAAKAVELSGRSGNAANVSWETLNIGVAYTYNEPLVAPEFVRDTAKLVREAGLVNVLVSNGMADPKIFESLLPYIDAMNIDLKTGDPEKYKSIGGNLDTVLANIKSAAYFVGTSKGITDENERDPQDKDDPDAKTGIYSTRTRSILNFKRSPEEVARIGRSCHVELTYLVVPGFNDTEEDIKQAAKLVAEIDPRIPFHVTRFFPAADMKNVMPTRIDVLLRLVEAAKQYLTDVIPGNI
ncbi:MAG: radical SAM protein [Clostridia bacterium]|nr:radical SAM protein [Clostridia bacterium]